MPFLNVSLMYDLINPSFSLFYHPLYSDEESVDMFGNWIEDFEDWSNLDDKEYFNSDDNSDLLDSDESFDY